MKAIDSPYIIKLYDIVEENGKLHLLMEYCNGGDLMGYQARLKPRVFDLEKATRALRDVILGLESLHSSGYLHRDIKAQNVLVKI